MERENEGKVEEETGMQEEGGGGGVSELQAEGKGGEG